MIIWYAYCLVFAAIVETSTWMHALFVPLAVLLNALICFSPQLDHKLGLNKGFQWHYLRCKCSRWNNHFCLETYVRQPQTIAILKLFKVSRVASSMKSISLLLYAMLNSTWSTSPWSIGSIEQPFRLLLRPKIQFLAPHRCFAFSMFF